MAKKEYTIVDTSPNDWATRPGVVEGKNNTDLPTLGTQADSRDEALKEARDKYNK